MALTKITAKLIINSGIPSTPQNPYYSCCRYTLYPPFPPRTVRLYRSFCRSQPFAPVFDNLDVKEMSIFFNFFFFFLNQRQQRYEPYEREGTTAQGEGGHHGVHVFFILQTGIKTAVGMDTKLKTYMNYINGNERQPSGNKDNQGQKR